MAPLARLWTLVTGCLKSLSFSNLDDYGYQHPVGGVGGHNVLETVQKDLPPPRFTPPGSNIPKFECKYPQMKGWRECHTKDQTCWLEEIDGPGRFDVYTDYENDGPIGIDRYHTLIVSDGWINADGMNFTEAKLINGSFPGPLLEACWGDRVHVTVVNNLAMNGTSIHWHGIRQLNNSHMDGVNGVTQCPIPPGSSFTYVWNATQFGSSWFHSHYSVQYADGVQAPITLHGPTSLNYTDSIAPLLMTDWAHISAFAAAYVGSVNPVPSLLLNGTGNVTRYNSDTENTTTIPPIYTMKFSSDPAPGGGPRRYLIRLINTAFDTGLIFSIDHHELWIVEADFVPVKPYKVDSILVAIGQRYMIVVEAKPSPGAKDGNYWIRTYAACPGVFFNGTDNYYKTGVLRYGDSTSEPTTHPVREICVQCVEHNERLVPQWPWTVGTPSNGALDGEKFNIETGPANPPGQYGTAFLSLQPPTDQSFNPFQTDYGNPMFLQLDSQLTSWPVGWMVVPENYTSHDWAYIVIKSSPNAFGPHPMHLHGHDFAILQTSYKPYCKDAVKLNTKNPPRRDVVYIPLDGFVIIGFKTDNPGNWLIHCHIATHASGGLAMQILERQADANALWPHATSPAIKEAQNLCAAWNSWAYDCRNFWPGLVDGTYPACDNATMLQNDSGI